VDLQGEAATHYPESMTALCRIRRYVPVAYAKLTSPVLPWFTPPLCGAPNNGTSAVLATR